MFTVGLTGGVGSGKSTVAAMFAEHGVPIIDMDIVARELVEPGQPALDVIRETFDPDILTADGHLDRQRLRNIVFTNPNKRKQLEGILHPRIRQEVIRRLQMLDAPYAIVVIPLLVESGQADLVQHILVIDVPEPVQIQRTAQRDSISAELVSAIIAAQATRQQRLDVAQDIIENTGDIDTLRQQVATLNKKYLMLAGIGHHINQTPL